MVVKMSNKFKIKITLGLIWKNFYLVLIGISILGLSSCIEIIETITINNDLSGKMIFSIESNELAALLSNFSGSMDQSYEKEIERAIIKYVGVLENEDGISSVDYIIDKGRGNFGFSFEFENTEKLNIALYNISGNRKGFFSPSYLKVGKRKLKKLNIAPWVKKYLKRENIEVPESSITDLITYKSVYKLPGKIKSVSGEKAKIKSNKQSVSSSFPLTAMIENQVNSGIKIRFKTSL